MFLKSFLVLAAVSSCSYAQQAAADVASGLDSITQGLADLETLVKAVSAFEQQQPVVDKYKSVFDAENNFASANSQAPSTAYTDAEQEQLCSSLIKSAKQHTSLLEAFTSQRIAFISPYDTLIASLLGNDEKITDLMVYQIGDMTPSCQSTTKGNSDALAVAFSLASREYSQ